MRLAGDAVMEQDLPSGHQPSSPLAPRPEEAEEHSGTCGPSSPPPTLIFFPFCPNFPNRRRSRWVAQRHICFGLADEQ